MMGSVQDSRAFEQIHHRLPEAMKVRRRGLFACYHYQVPSLLDWGQSRRLPEPPFYLVSHHRIPNSSSHREAEPTGLQIVGMYDKDK